MTNKLILVGMVIALAGCRAATIVEQVVSDDRLDLTYPSGHARANVVSGSIFDNGAKLYPAGRSYSTGNHQGR